MALKQADKKIDDKGETAPAIPWHETKPEERFGGLLREVYREFSKSLQLRLGDTPISIGHWVFYRILWNEDGLTQREISDRAGMMEPTTFSALKRMEQLGFIKRVRSKADRRNVHIHLTKKGRQLEHILMPILIDLNNVALAGVSNEERAITRKVFMKIQDNLTRDQRLRKEPSS